MATSRAAKSSISPAPTTVACSRSEVKPTPGTPRAALGAALATTPPVELAGVVHAGELLEEVPRPRRVEPVRLVRRTAHGVARHRERDDEVGRLAAEEVRSAGVPEARPAVTCRGLHGQAEPRLLEREEALERVAADSVEEERVRARALVLADSAVADRGEGLVPQCSRGLQVVEQPDAGQLRRREARSLVEDHDRDVERVAEPAGAEERVHVPGAAEGARGARGVLVVGGGKRDEERRLDAGQAVGRGLEDAGSDERPRTEDVEAGTLLVPVGQERADIRMQVAVGLSERDRARRA